MRSVFSSLRSLTSQIIATSVAAVCVTALLLGFLTWRALERDVDNTLDIKTRWSLRVAAEAFISYYPDYELKYDADGDVTRLVGPKVPDFSDNEAVDRITRINRGTATIFRYDGAKEDFIRLSTSVKKADGSRAIGTYLGSGGPVYPVIMERLVYRGVANILGEPYQTGYMPIVGQDGAVNGILYIGVGKLAELKAQSAALYRTIGYASLAVLAATALLGGLLSRRLMAPLPALALVTRQIADEKLEGEIPYQQRRDECGRLAKSLATLRLALKERAELRDRETAANRDEIERARRREQDVLAFRAAVTQLTGEISMGSAEMDQAATRLSAVVASTANMADGAREAVAEASEGISVVAASADELNATIREVASRAEQSASMVAEAVRTSESSRAGVAMLGEAAERIGEVIAAIRGISEQTNLLALNATIEAARAGESGRGFAVVAGEVKLLASQTGRATDEIGRQIAELQAASRQAVAAFESIAGKLEGVRGATSSIAASVEQQGAATGEIARNATKVAGGAEELNANVLGVEEMASRARESVDLLEATAARFRNGSSELASAVDDFLRRMAA
jgi:methyl-accepting chemotaxis protein